MRHTVGHMVERGKRIRASLLKISLLGAAFTLLFVGSSCSSNDSDALCGPSNSIGVIASAIAVGQYEFDEMDGGTSLRIDVLTAIGQLAIVVDDGGQDLAAQAQLLNVEFQKFLDIADSLEWNDTLMSSDLRIDAVIVVLNSDSGVFATTAVDSYIAAECGRNDGGVDSGGAGLPTLPSPAISAPTATDPPMEMPNDNADAQAIGETVAALFGLQLPAEVALCLGQTLSAMSDVTAGNATSAEYQAQFQLAFDLCRIDFQIPIDDAGGN